MTLTASFAGFFLKKSTAGGTVLSVIKNKFLYFGGFLYIIGALLNILLIKKLPFSFVISLGSICYVWTMVIARVFLREKIGKEKIVGILLILSGVFCIVV
jgi:drug/metabolite transporter (DMT)-like permease